MNPAIAILFAAFVLGATSGLSPGPLLALVVAESFQRGFRAGAAVAVAPLITDPPIILLMMILTHALASVDYIMGGLYILGACYLTYLSIEIFRFRGMEMDKASNVRTSILKGVTVNLLNPSPYVFWLTIGAPLLVQGEEISWAIVALFLCIFYGMLVGVKLALAVLVGRNRHLLEGGYYKAVTWLMGFSLLFFAAVFIKSGIEKIIG